MKQKFTMMLLLFTSGFSIVNAQWTKAGKFNNVVNDMLVIYNQLYIAGNFSQYDGGDCFFTAYWNDSIMTKTTDALSGTGVRRLLNFQNTLYGTNALNFPINKGLAIYNMNTWYSESGITSPQTGIYANNNYLFVGSDAGILSRKSTISTMYEKLTDSIGGAITAITEYNGRMIVAGNFTTIKGGSYNHIAAYGTNFTALSSGLDGNVSRLQVYNGKLYACGTFMNAGGNPAKFLARWNDTTWSQVGGGIVSAGTSGIMDMMVYNNALYIVGEFSKAGNANAMNIAKWNDTSWTSFGYNKPGYISSIEAYKGKFYVASYSGDSAILYKTAITSGINKFNHESINATIYPNPAKNQINISLDDDFDVKLTYEIISLDGLVQLTNKLNGTDTTINIDALKSGIYIIRIKGENGEYAMRKIIIL
ncbi:MAG: T9SS type A sorting domain-containing protein [Bacteroidota bacterium]|nr:T9SS type A sorting domain-containing protein [Bacteroidota bacterium]